MRQILILCFSFAVVSAFAQTISGTIKSGGIVREYRLYKPAVYTGDKPVPLVINLHGYSSNNFEQEYYGSFHKIADTANFLVVMPNGTLDNTGNRFWNTFGGPSSVDDVQFINQLIDTLLANYNIDRQRIYSTGMSNGGFMSYTLACKLSNRIAAIASVTGSMIVPALSPCNPQHPVPVMEIHGTADPVVPYNGGTILNFAPVQTVLNKWIALNHCNTTPLITPVPNTNLADGCEAEKIVYSGGDKGTTVEHFKILGGGHTWPGAFFVTGVTNQDINASYEIWQFFRRYRLDLLSATQTPENNLLSWNIAPNPSAGDLYVTLDLTEPTPVRFEIYDLTGALKWAGEDTRFPAGIRQKQIDLRQLPSGVFVFRVKMGNIILNKKLIIN